MKPQTSKNIRLGIMVIAGTFLMIGALYLIGDKQNLFGSTFRLSVYFKDVNGLMVGNNVRLVGINVGTVTEIEIVNDSTVRVDMAIELDSKPYIRKNAIATIGTDGLMGNKLVNIKPGGSSAPGVEEGDFLQSSSPLETEAALRTLAGSNDDVAVIAHNLRLFTEQMNAPGSTWQILTDTMTARQIKNALSSISLASQYSAQITLDLATLVSDIRSGEGMIGELLSDTVLVAQLRQSLLNVQAASDSLLLFSGDLLTVSDEALNGDGAFQTMLSDSAFDRELTQTVSNINRASEDLDEIMKAVKDNFLLRHYFKKQEKQRLKDREQVD